MLKWMTLLCTELSRRIAVDREAWSRRATKLTLQMISLKPGGRCAPSRARSLCRDYIIACGFRAPDEPTSVLPTGRRSLNETHSNVGVTFVCLRQVNVPSLDHAGVCQSCLKAVPPALRCSLGLQPIKRRAPHSRSTVQLSAPVGRRRDLPFVICQAKSRRRSGRKRQARANISAFSNR